MKKFAHSFSAPQSSETRASKSEWIKKTVDEFVESGENDRCVLTSQDITNDDLLEYEKMIRNNTWEVKLSAENIRQRKLPSNKYLEETPSGKVNQNLIMASIVAPVVVWQMIFFPFAVSLRKENPSSLKYIAVISLCAAIGCFLVFGYFMFMKRWNIPKNTSGNRIRFVEKYLEHRDKHIIDFTRPEYNYFIAFINSKLYLERSKKW